MAKRISHEEIRLDYVINGDPAKKELFKLEQDTRKLNATNKQLRAEKKKLRLEGKQGTEQYKKLSAEISKNSLTISTNKKRMEVLQKQIGLTGLTMSQLQSRATVLRLTLRNMVPGSGKYKKFRNELRQVTARLTKLKNEARGAAFSLRSLSRGFNQYAVLGATIIATFTGVIFKLQQMIDFNGKLADAQSDVQKTTQLSKEEVDELTKSFGILLTRTSRINLLKIAEEGGRIGIIKEEIGDFVEVMNQANVALGDSFKGGVEEIASKLGKLKFLFKETKDLRVDLAYNAIGSAINELGANGVATELNMTNFALRVGSMPEALKPTVSEALALGAAFEESGVQAEIAARGYDIFLKKAADNAEKFGKVMGLSTKEVEALINENPLEFFLKFADSLRGMSGVDVAKTLKEVGVNALGASKIVSAAGNNMDRFRELLDLSNESLIDATSLTKEYNIKNNNLAATIEKVRKRLLAMFTSQNISEGLNNFLIWVGKFIGAVEDGDGKVTKWRNRFIALLKTLIILTASILSYKLAVQLATFWTNRATQGTAAYNLIQKVTAATTNFLTAATLLGRAAFFLLTGQLKAARSAMIAFNLIANLSPFGLIAGLITAVAVAYVLFSESAEEAATKQSMLNDATNKAKKQNVDTITGLKELLRVARDRELSLEARQNAIDKLNETVPEYNGNLTLESVNTLDATNKLNTYIESLERRILLEILEAELKKKLREQIDAENSSLEDNIVWYEQLWNQLKSGPALMTAQARNYRTAINNKTQLVDATKEEIQIIKELIKNQKRINDRAGDNGPKEDELKEINGVTFIFKNGKWQKVKVFVPEGDDKENKSSDKRKQQLASLNRELLALERKSQDDRLALMEEGFEKERVKELINNQRKIDDLKNQLIKEAEFKKIDKDIDTARSEGDTAKVDFLTQQKEIWTKKNTELNAQIISQEKLHQLKLGIVEQNAGKKSIKDLEDKFKREKAVRETNFNNELSQVTSLEQVKEQLKDSLSTKELQKIKTLADAKKALQDQFNKEELEKHREFLEQLVELLELSLKGQGPIDLNLLTSEQIEELKLKAEEIALILSKLKGENPSGVDSIIAEELSDIFGMTPTQWDQLFKNLSEGKFKIEDIGTAIQGLVGVWKLYDQFVTASENKRLAQFENNTNRRKEGLKRQLDSGQITQEQYNKSIEKLDTNLDKKKKEIQYNQAKRQKQITIAGIISSTALAVVGALSNKPWSPANFILAAIVGGMGALQLAVAAKQSLPAKGFETGLFPVQREQDGRIFNSEFGGDTRSGIVKRPTVFLAGENNRPEMIIDNNAFRKMNPDVRNSMLREVARVKGFEKGSYPDTVTKPNFTEDDTSSNLNDALIVALNRNSAILEKIEEEGLLAVVNPKDIKSMKQLKEGIDNFNTLRSNNKI